MNAATTAFGNAETASVPQHIHAHLEQIAGPVESVEEAISAQQRVLIVSLRKTTTAHADVEWMHALEAGRNRVVVRIWMGSSRWWNLNHPSTTQKLWSGICEQEVWGYRCARRALKGTAIRIPRVLHVSAIERDDEYPWAIFEYVGFHSTLFDDSIVPDESWTNSMIKVRDEFGFDEPHPRWGRVRVEDCLEYAFTVLESVILPLHRYYFSSNVVLTEAVLSFNFYDMIELYKTKFETFIATKSVESGSKSGQLQDAIQKLGRAIERLSTEAMVNQGILKELPLVLCHMDCQPQNLVFARQKGRHSSKQENAASIVSVLDWEEAALADPRFELLMLCRKVCANRKQAGFIWHKYEKQMNIKLGSIEPWLKLETVHSLTTLLLQATAGGGRSPWESNPDLWVKIEKEFLRLAKAGQIN